MLTVQGQKQKEKYEFVKEKTISKTYPSSGNKLSIENSFGTVKFVASSKNEIKVDIRVETSSNNEGLASQLLNAISVSDKHEGNDIVFKTSIKTDKNDCKNCKSSMRIDYEVSLPVTVALKVANSFGDTQIPDYTGQLAVTSKFGSVTAGKLEKLKSLSIEFGSADINSISDLDAVFKFSKLNIANLSGKNKIKLEFCDEVQIRLDTDISSLDLNESYSTVNIKPPSGISVNYSVNTSFGHFINRTSTDVKRTDEPKKYGSDSEKKYEGQSGTGVIKIELKSSFGRIVLGDPAPGDMKKEKGAKSNKGDKGEKGDKGPKATPIVI
jgi:hypothetical protein